MLTFGIVVLFILGLYFILSAIQEEMDGPEFIVMLFLGFVFIAPLLIKVYRIVL